MFLRTLRRLSVLEYRQRLIDGSPFLFFLPFFRSIEWLFSVSLDPYIAFIKGVSSSATARLAKELEVRLTLIAEALCKEVRNIVVVHKISGMVRRLSQANLEVLHCSNVPPRNRIHPLCKKSVGDFALCQLLRSAFHFTSSQPCRPSLPLRDRMCFLLLSSSPPRSSLARWPPCQHSLPCPSTRRNAKRR